MPITYYLEPKEAQALIEAYTPGEKLPRKGRTLIIARPYLMPSMKIEPWFEDSGKRLFQVTEG